ncbi:MAG TPA: isoprenyl transferase [Candidatus Omnitrophota bacterium]|nr:isoprenyl transferase [Candidatus Omnitrophota bacterium]HPS37703.1 isoprenyl transferase [Candidatus Omnitrophota bacterium]
MPNDIPKHVAIIMDGNGRWAKRQGLMRIKGHEVGVQRVEEIIRVADAKGIRYLTFYAFSKENWQRPKQEVEFLMGLLSLYIDSKLDAIIKNNMVFNVIGEVRDLPDSLQKKLARAMAASGKNTGLTVTFALSYSGRREITLACRKIAEEVRKGTLSAEAITEETVAANLYTAGIPDPELLIRTSGELRVSNFLLWQISYAELYITQKFWPEFTAEEFDKALEDYQKRERRFGRTCATDGKTL